MYDEVLEPEYTVTVNAVFITPKDGEEVHTTNDVWDDAQLLASINPDYCKGDGTLPRATTALGKMHPDLSLINTRHIMKAAFYLFP